MRITLLALTLQTIAIPAMAQQPAYVDQPLTEPTDTRYYSLVCRSADKGAVKWEDARNVVLRTVGTVRIVYFAKGASRAPVSYAVANDESCETFRE